MEKSGHNFLRFPPYLETYVKHYVTPFFAKFYSLLPHISPCNIYHDAPKPLNVLMEWQHKIHKSCKNPFCLRKCHGESGKKLQQCTGHENNFSVDWCFFFTLLLNGIVDNPLHFPHNAS